MKKIILIGTIIIIIGLLSGCFESFESKGKIVVTGTITNVDMAGPAGVPYCTMAFDDGSSYYPIRPEGYGKLSQYIGVEVTITFQHDTGWYELKTIQLGD